MNERLRDLAPFGSSEPKSAMSVDLIEAADRSAEVGKWPDGVAKSLFAAWDSNSASRSRDDRATPSRARALAPRACGCIDRRLPLVSPFSGKSAAVLFGTFANTIEPFRKSVFDNAETVKRWMVLKSPMRLSSESSARCYFSWA